jgi:D-glycero-alpha-D-manno-heptose-7-phosphate kinase
MIITKTPLRISLIGGGTDVSTFYQVSPGEVISFSIDKYVYVSVNKKFDNKLRVSYSKTENVNNVYELDHELVRECLKLFKINNGLEITSISDIPGNGTGLGSSSSFTVGLLNALSILMNGKEVHPKLLAEGAYIIESTKCGHPVGKQDQYAASFGGMNNIQFNKSGVGLYRLPVSSTWKKELMDHSMLLWTGMNRDANKILRKQYVSFKNGGNIEHGKILANLVKSMRTDILDECSMGKIGELINESWNIKKMFSPDISNTAIDDLYKKSLYSGAIGGKILGAGGGGFLYLIAPPKKHKIIEESTGLRKVDFNISENGSEIIYHG